MSNKQKYPKAVRKQFQQLWYKAYEREMAQALAELEAHFVEWRTGEIDALQLNELIHKHHHGAAREIFKTYAYGTGIPDWEVIIAASRGILTHEDIPDEVWAYVQESVENWRKFHSVHSDQDEES